MVKDRKKYYISLLITGIIEKVRGDKNLPVDHDMILEVHSRGKVGISTLKRLFGIDQTNPGYLPSALTLHKLSRFLGYEDWNDFVKRNQPIDDEDQKKESRKVFLGNWFRKLKQRYSSIGYFYSLQATFVFAALAYLFQPQKVESPKCPEPEPVIDRTGMIPVQNPIHSRLPKPPLIYPLADKLTDQSICLSPENDGWADGCYTFKMPVFDRHRSKTFHASGYFWVPDGYKIVAIAYFQATNGASHSQNELGGSNIQVELSKDFRSAKWYRSYNGLPILEYYRIYWKRVRPFPFLPKWLYQKIIRLWDKQAKHAASKCWNFTIQSSGEKVSTRSGPECIQKGIIATCLGREQEAIEWISAYDNCRDPFGSKVYNKYQNIVIPFIFDDLGQYHQYLDYPVDAVDSSDYFAKHLPAYPEEY